MLLIAHRANINGPNPDKENHPDYIANALFYGYDVEIDVWYINNKFILGHDKPTYEVNKNFLLNEQFWHHAKNMEALFELNKIHPNYMINCFYHNNDDCVLTSGGWVWTYPKILPLCEQSIAVMPERVPNWEISKAYGICSDFVEKYKK